MNPVHTLPFSHSITFRVPFSIFFPLTPRSSKPSIVFGVSHSTSVSASFLCKEIYLRIVKWHKNQFLVPRVAEMELLGTRSSVRLICLSVYLFHNYSV